MRRGTRTPPRLLHLVFCALLASPAVATQSFGEATWRAGDTLLSEAAADAEGWQAIDCHGAGCEALMAVLHQHLPADAQRDRAGRWEVRAELWHTEQLSHFGPFRADEPIGGDPPTPGTPWLDARYDAVDCAWRGSDGEHRLSIGAGAVARYTDPTGTTHPLALQRVEACARCRAHYLRLTWRDLAAPERGVLSARWADIEFIRGGEGHMGGFAGWSGEKVQPMQCVSRAAP